MTESAKEKSEGWLSQARTLRSQNLWHALLQLPVPHSAGSDPEVSLLLAEALLKEHRLSDRDAALRALSLLASPLRTPTLRPRALLLSGLARLALDQWEAAGDVLSKAKSLLPSGSPDGSSAIPTSFCRPRGRILGSSRGGRRPGNPSAPDFWQPGGSPPGQSPTPEA